MKKNVSEFLANTKNSAQAEMLKALNRAHRLFSKERSESLKKHEKNPVFFSLKRPKVILHAF